MTTDTQALLLAIAYMERVRFEFPAASLTWCAAMAFDWASRARAPKDVVALLRRARGRARAKVGGGGKIIR